MKKSLLVLSVAASMALAEVYTLGQVHVQTQTADDINMIEQSVSAQTIAQNNERTIAESLDNISGVSLNTTGARGETKLSIRGFNANRVGVFIDGIPVYVPYDGNFDYGRFLTNDVAQIDISKGYSSVVYGANTMGGVVNIVSKKPTKELEGNIRAELIFDSRSKLAKHVESINVGTRIDGFYAQLSGVYSNRDHFRLSDSYTPVAGSVQPEGDRLRSFAKDQKISLKAGYIADDGSEIAISYANQQGHKQQQASVDATKASVRYWDWPYWDKETISVSGVKNFESSYIKALAYYDISKNSLFSYADETYSSFNNFGRTFKSRYDDYSYGARLEYGLELEDHFLKIAANYKKDVHRGYDIEKFVSGEALAEQYEDTTYSLGIEDEYTFSKSMKILLGASYDTLKADKIYDTNTAFLNMLTLKSSSALNPQAALIYTIDLESKLRASISQKTYMPSMKDRYSRRLGRSAPNVDLENEIANHYELGYTRQQKNLSMGVNLYYSKVKDAIAEQVFTPDPSLMQLQNVGDFEHKGVELDITYKTQERQLGVNYAYVDVENLQDKDIKRTGLPEHQIFAYGQQKIGAGLSLYANVKLRSGIYDQVSDGSYVDMPSFVTTDAKVIYEPMKTLVLEVGVKNITDKYVEYNVGFPEAGREYFAAMNYKF